jgi:uncharacterized low-complexity protein
MSNKPAIHSLTATLGVLFTVSIANTSVTSAAENPFRMEALSGGRMMLAEGKCGASKGAEGKCGMGRMDADGDGNVTRDEFMQGHEAMFEKIDKNADGVIDQTEGDAHIKEMRQFMKEGKCGPGKFGGSE